MTPRPLGDFAGRLGDCLRSAAPAGSDGTVALLSEGPDSVAYSEHQMLSEELGIESSPRATFRPPAGGCTRASDPAAPRSTSSTGASTTSG